MGLSLTQKDLEQQPQAHTVGGTQVADAPGASSLQLSAEAPCRMATSLQRLGRGTKESLTFEQSMCWISGTRCHFGWTPCALPNLPPVTLRMAEFLQADFPLSSSPCANGLQAYSFPSWNTTFPHNHLPHPTTSLILSSLAPQLTGTKQCWC